MCGARKEARSREREGRSNLAEARKGLLPLPTRQGVSPAAFAGGKTLRGLREQKLRGARRRENFFSAFLRWLCFLLLSHSYPPSFSPPFFSFPCIARGVSFSRLSCVHTQTRTRRFAVACCNIHFPLAMACVGGTEEENRMAPESFRPIARNGSK